MAPPFYYWFSSLILFPSLLSKVTCSEFMHVVKQRRLRRLAQGIRQKGCGHWALNQVPYCWGCQTLKLLHYPPPPPPRLPLLLPPEYFSVESCVWATTASAHAKTTLLKRPQNTQGTTDRPLASTLQCRGRDGESHRWGHAERAQHSRNSQK